jgi:hypothetical protein
MHRGLRFYSRYFQEAGERVTGDITPSYSLLPLETIRVIRDVCPALRILFLLRDPVERAWSHALMELLKVRRRSYETVTPEEFAEHFHCADSLERGQYTRILDRWSGVFPPEAVFVGFYDEIARGGETLMRGICRHLDIHEDLDWSVFPLRETVHRGAGFPLPEALRGVLRELYAPELERLRARFGERVAAWGESIE